MMNTLLIGAALVLATPAPKELPKSTVKLEGTWVLTNAAEIKGKDVGPDEVITFVIGDGKIVIVEGARKRERPEDANYEADFTKKPATIDIKPMRAGAGKESLVKGIVEVSGDTMKLCFGKDGTDRPTEFKTDKEKRVTLMVFKRQADVKK